MHGWLFTALLPPPWRAPPGARGTAPALVEYVGTLYTPNDDEDDDGPVWLNQHFHERADGQKNATALAALDLKLRHSDVCSCIYH